MHQGVARWRVRRFELQSERSQTAGAGPVEHAAVLQEVSVQVQTDVRLKTLGESLQHRVHVDAVGEGPSVLEVLLEALTQRVRDLMESDELADAQHLGVVARCARVETLDDGRNVAEDAGVHQG